MASPEQPVQALSPVSPSEEHQELRRILASAAFRSAPRLSRMLRYVVERAIAGDAETLKEYPIGVEVFDRQNSFDPRIDTIVRVQARRLRKRLAEYYAGEGAASPVRVEIPKGSYRPKFVAATTGQPLRINSLPAPRTSLIARQQELRALAELLSRDHVRLVTVSGPGGVGKTRLAIEAAANLGNRFPGGVTFIELATAKVRADAVALIAQAYALYRSDGRPVEDALSERLRVALTKPALLVLDNFEHMLDSAGFISKLLDDCGPLKILVTSRAILHLYGEHEFPTPPLEAPQPESARSLRDLSQSPAVRLFLARAKAVKPDFDLTPENVRTVASICCRLDGLPLAIELAAGRSKTLEPDVLFEKLSSPLHLLTAGPRDAPDRQRTLLATIRWSYDLLTNDEKRLLRRLAVFMGGCTGEGLEAVGNAYEDLSQDVCELAGSLVDKNLLQLSVDRSAPQRYIMLQVIREYALQELGSGKESAATRRAHAAYFLVVAEEGERKLSEDERDEWFAHCDREYGNLSAALDWLLQAGASNWYARLAIALFQYWERRERLDEGRQRLDAVLDLADLPEEYKARAAGFAGALIGMQADIGKAITYHQRALEIYRKLDLPKYIAREANSLSVGFRFTQRRREARQMLEECLAACRRVGDQNQIAATLSNLGGVAAEDGDFEEAAALLHEARSTFREIGNWLGEAWSLNHLGDQARMQGDAEAAQQHYCDSLNLFRALKDPWGEGRTLHDLAEIAYERDDVEETERLLRQALHVFSGLQHHRGIAKVLDSLAVVHGCHFQAEAAYQLAGAAATMREALGANPSPWKVEDSTRLKSALNRALALLSAERAQDAWDRGRAMDFDEAVRYAAELRSDAKRRQTSG